MQGPSLMAWLSALVCTGVRFPSFIGGGFGKIYQNGRRKREQEVDWSALLKLIKLDCGEVGGLGNGDPHLSVYEIRQGLGDRVVCDMHNHQTVIEAHKRQKRQQVGHSSFSGGEPGKSHKSQ
ncbi:hypothetical protein QQP08_025730 [Theobroma cacao]|nr:hypothetical protein QQP08_025730 [Theobroma cacao]